MSTGLYDKILPPSEKKRIVIFDYSPKCVKELNVTAGEEVFVKKTMTKWWVEARTKDGQVGYIPKTYLAVPNTLEANPWYFPELSPGEAEQILLNQEPGTFLVRPSANSKTTNKLSLSIRTNIPEKFITHYRIFHDKEQGYHIHDNVFSKSLEKLISFYQRDTNNKLNMIHALVKICPKTPPRIFRLAPHNKPISFDEITTIKKVGSGNFAKVYSGYYHQFKIAIKEPYNMMITSNDKLWEKEVTPLRELCHPNVVTFYGYCLENKWMIFEFVDYCLQDQLRNKIYQNNPKHLLLIAMQVARGMKYIHSKKYVHRDLAARNVLITMDIQAKISDFGLSRKVNKKGNYNLLKFEEGGTPYKWEAIECLQKGIYNKATDIWAFGVLMYEIYSEGAEPYPVRCGREWLLQFLNDGKRLEKPDQMDDNTYKLVTKCWLKNSKKRPRFDTIYNSLLSFDR